MQELFEAVKAWPVIVQGALGSALFSLVLILAERIRKLATAQYSKHSKSNRLSYLINEQARLEAILADTREDQVVVLTFIFYRASRPALKAAMWLLFGLTMDTMFSPAGLIGYTVSLFYLMRSYALVAPITDEEPAEKLKAVNEEIEKLEGKVPVK